MVFSNECNDADLQGKGIFVPFNNNPLSLKSLELQTKELIKSERKRSEFDNDKFNWGWGTLTIAINPEILKETSEKYNEAKSLLSFWSKRDTNGFNPNHYKVGDEKSILSKQGVLNFLVGQRS